jgi:hypothetical protein
MSSAFLRLQSSRRFEGAIGRSASVQTKISLRKYPASLYRKTGRVLPRGTKPMRSCTRSTVRPKICSIRVWRHPRHLLCSRRRLRPPLLLLSYPPPTCLPRRHLPRLEVWGSPLLLFRLPCWLFLLSLLHPPEQLLLGRTTNPK